MKIIYHDRFFPLTVLSYLLSSILPTPTHPHTQDIITRKPEAAGKRKIAELEKEVALVTAAKSVLEKNGEAVMHAQADKEEEEEEEEQEEETEAEAVTQEEEVIKSKSKKGKKINEQGIKERKLPKAIKENPPSKGKNVSSKEKKEGKKAKTKLRQ